ncbi:hypothetical protein LZ30DRAFT_291827 [Colletotrichum cereale]|nr:hypothetical protein LZ30DRAFT_291827 [Colletotrichum cereale]
MVPIYCSLLHTLWIHLTQTQSQLLQRALRTRAPATRAFCVDTRVAAGTDPTWIGHKPKFQGRWLHKDSASPASFRFTKTEATIGTTTTTGRLSTELVASIHIAIQHLGRGIQSAWHCQGVGLCPPSPSPRPHRAHS